MDVAALARKDLTLELRAKDTLPAMILFVLSTLVVFHFALPAGTGDGAAYGLLWVALVFTALLGLGRAWVPENEGRRAGRARARAVRPECDLARQVAGHARVPGCRRGRRAACVRPPLRAARRGRDRRRGACDVGICTVGSLARRQWPLPAAAARLILPLLFLPLSIPLIVGGVGASISADGGKYLLFLALYDGVFSILSWASFEYVVTE